MKNLLFLFSFILILASCGKEELIETSQNVSQFLSYSKSMSLVDKEGNSVDLTIFTNTQEALDNQTKDVLHLFANKRQHSNSSTQPLDSDLQENQDGDLQQDDDEQQDNFVYIEVNKYDFADDVTGFKIDSDIEDFGQQSINRYSESHYHYAFGAGEINGARVLYRQDTRSKEYLTIKFEKKTASSNIFWQSLATATLHSTGDEWDYCSSSYWHMYKLKVKVHRARGCCYAYDWEFLIHCE